MLPDEPPPPPPKPAAKAAPKPEPKPAPKPKPKSKPKPVADTPAASSSRRFTDNGNGNGNGTDNRTGLIWLKNANCFGYQDWSTAMDSASGLSSGACGLRDRSKAGQWRLPSKEEWKALIDALAGEPFTGIQSDYYWTGDAWAVSSNSGSVGEGSSKSGAYFVWPVRGGR